MFIDDKGSYSVECLPNLIDEYHLIEERLQVSDTGVVV